MSIQCIKRTKNKSNAVISYTLKDESGRVVEVKPDKLREVLAERPNYVSNLQLGSDGRIIVKGDISKLDVISYAEPDYKSKSSILNNSMKSAYRYFISKGYDDLKVLLLQFISNANDSNIKNSEIYTFLKNCANGMKKQYAAECQRNTAISNDKSRKQGYNYIISSDDMALIMYLNTNFILGTVQINSEIVEPAYQYQDIIEIMNLLAE